MNDLRTMVWKEVKDSVFSGGRGALIRPLLLIFILGILLPWQMGQSWLKLSAPMILVSCYVPFFFIISYIGDAIAGERERHTLETLLASRISDRAILWGKMIVSVLYAWGMLVIGLLLGLVAANLASGQAGWQFYSPFSTLLEVLALGLVLSLLSSSGGVLISLRAATVRQAQQTMTVGIMVLFVGGILVLKAVLTSGTSATLDLSSFLLLLIGGIAVLDVIFLGILFASFKRSRLILS